MILKSILTKAPLSTLPFHDYPMQNFGTPLDPTPEIWYEMGKERINVQASLREKIRIASGEGQADLLIKNGRVIDVLSGEIEKKDVAIYAGTGHRVR